MARFPCNPSGALVGLVLGACAPGSTEPPAQQDPGVVVLPEAAAEGAVPGVAAPQAEAPGAAGLRSSDPRLLALVDAVDRGRLDRVQALLPRVLELPGLEAEIACARARLLLGQRVEALAAVESMRRRYPDQPVVMACSIEVYALLGEEGSAEEALRAALEFDAKHPEIERARGVTLLFVPGAASAALQHLELALLADPALPYAQRPLAEARRLVARQAMAGGDSRRAEMHVLAALDYDPVHVGTRLLYADVLAAQADFEGAIAIHEELLLEGAGREQELGTLHKQAAMARLLEGERPDAIEHFLRARDLGLTGDLLGWGAQALRDEAETELERGHEVYAAGELDAARSAFEYALRLDPESLEAAHVLGAVLFRQEQYEDAAELWSTLLEQSLQTGEVLPVPVHLDLARAQRLAGELDTARAVLEDYLEREPQGEWAEETREMMERL